MGAEGEDRDMTQRKSNRTSKEHPGSTGTELSLKGNIVSCHVY